MFEKTKIKTIYNKQKSMKTIYNYIIEPIYTDLKSDIIEIIGYTDKRIGIIKSTPDKYFGVKTPVKYTGDASFKVSEAIHFQDDMAWYPASIEEFIPEGTLVYYQHKVKDRKDKVVWACPSEIMGYQKDGVWHGFGRFEILTPVRNEEVRPSGLILPNFEVKSNDTLKENFLEYSEFYHDRGLVQSETLGLNGLDKNYKAGDVVYWGKGGAHYGIKNIFDDVIISVNYHHISAIITV